MNHIELLFLEALRASLKNEKVNWETPMPEKDWCKLFRIAESHHVLPLIYEAVFRCPAANLLETSFLVHFQEKVKLYVFIQMMKTNEFYMLNNYLTKEGIQPLVVKGLICRNLYPEPDYRLSSDEDLLIREEDYARCHDLLMAYGMQVTEKKKDIENLHEVSYIKPGRHLYIELHKQLFAPDSNAFSHLNEFFEGVHERSVKEINNGMPIYTMEYTDHLFYLICHAYKHFLHSGFGVRQVCDIVLFANHYKEMIDWDRVYTQCEAISALYFVSAILSIGENYLGYSKCALGLTKEWSEIDTDETAMLKDLLESGVYGSSDGSRVHSSNITLNAVSEKNNKFQKQGALLRTIFPETKRLSKQYTYLKRYPALLPVAWMERIWQYCLETGSSTGNSAKESIQIGNRRIELLKQYKILK